MYARREKMSNLIVVKTKPCCVCNEYEIWSLDQELVDRWRGGENIQRVFPDMSAGEREVLISGIHPACWDTLFPKEGANE
jgi:hypothetical protein